MEAKLKFKCMKLCLIFKIFNFTYAGPKAILTRNLSIPYR